MPEQVKTPPGQEEERLVVHYDTRLPKLTLLQRALIPIIGWAVWAVIRVLGPTIRFEVLGGQKAGRDYRPDLPPHIYAFWHRCIIAGAWYFRNRGGVLMNTTNFDGQWTRRVIERLGYGTAQGSSTRGGLRGLAVMARRLEEGVDAAFTIDGPRGPRYVAKPGPVMLARRSGRPVILFHIGLERAWTLKKTWDLMQIPKPYTRAVLVIAPVLEVSKDADHEGLEKKHQEMQKMLGAPARCGGELVFAHGRGAGTRARSVESGNQWRRLQPVGLNVRNCRRSPVSLVNCRLTRKLNHATHETYWLASLSVTCASIFWPPR